MKERVWFYRFEKCGEGVETKSVLRRLEGRVADTELKEVMVVEQEHKGWKPRGNQSPWEFGLAIMAPKRLGGCSRISAVILRGIFLSRLEH